MIKPDGNMRIYVCKNDSILKDENNLVTLRTEEGEYPSLEPRRLFPVSRPDEYITLLDSEGKEVALIKKLSELNTDSRKVICNSLDDYYLVPTITRIVSVVEKYGTLRWTVETDRGEISFDIRNRNHDIRVNPDRSIRVRDSNDNRYTIPDWQSLDKHSRTLLMPDL